MTYPEIARQRLFNQHIAGAKFEKPEQAVKWLGAVQAQDYAGAKWALGLRLQNSRDVAIDKALASGSIIRTHVLRPTWHFVAPEDLRWMLNLTVNRIKKFASPWYKKLELDDEIFNQSNDALAKALEGGKQLNRAEMESTLNRAGVATNDLRFIHLLMRAELDKIICSGARRGKQFTYALFDDRVPGGIEFVKEEALAELAKRYFTSRGPATLQDFAWWSGLTNTDARVGLALIKEDLTHITLDGTEFWMARDSANAAGKSAVAYLLPAFDEFAVAYHDRTATVNAKYLQQARHVIFDPSIVVNNQVVGTWRRTLSKSNVELSLNLFGKLSQLQAKAVDAAADRYRKFLWF